MATQDTAEFTTEMKVRQVAEQLGLLERKAGISGEAAKAREGPSFPLHFQSDTPLGSVQARREREEERLHEARHVTARIRHLYFGVADIETRRALIATSRSLHKLHHDGLCQAVASGRVALAKTVAQPKASGDMVLGPVMAAAGAYLAWSYGVRDGVRHAGGPPVSGPGLTFLAVGRCPPGS